MGLNIAKRKFGRNKKEGVTSNNIKRVQRSGEGAKQLFLKQYML